MKRIFTVLFAILPIFLSAQLLNENFAFTGNLTDNGWIITNNGGTTAPNKITASATGLTYSGFINSNIGNAAKLAISGEDIKKDLTSPWDSTVAPSIYASFMVNVVSAGTTGDYFCGFTSGSSGTNYNLRLFVKSVGSNIDFGVSRSNGTPAVYTGNSYSFATTYLVTIKYKYVGGMSNANDECSIYIHPIGSVTSSEPVSLNATYSTSGTGTGLDASQLNAFFVRQGASGNNVSVTIDGIRVSTDWGSSIPVELIDFKAQKLDQATKLEWSTATELNNMAYEIERSLDGKSFEKLGEVSGAGNSQVIRSYNFMDEKPNNGVNYYRLRQVDYDGTATVSKTIAVSFGKNTSVKVYPTVAKDNLNIELSNNDGTADLSVVNMLGQVVVRKNVQNTEGVISLSINDLANGSYILNVITKNGQMAQRFEKQ